MNIAIYLRKSRADPDSESTAETLARHKKTLLEFAKTSRLTVLEIYEEVVSGDGLFVRPEMVRLLSDIEKGAYEGVLCMDIDRLGRVDTKDRGIIIDTFKTNYTRILTPRKVYDLNDDIDEFSTEIQMLLARQELKKITQRMRAGINRSVADGCHVGEPPYGYRRVYVDKRPTLEICEEEANVIRMVYDMYVNQHMGSQRIADYLNSLGYSPRKNTHFSRTTIQFYLQNELYTGKIIYNRKHRVKKRNPDDKNKYILNPVSEWIISDGIHPPIIDTELFKAAQEIRLERTHPPSYKGIIENPFAGLIHCKKCGSAMRRQTSKKTSPRLICDTVGCMPSCTIADVEKIVIDALMRTVDEWRATLKKRRTKKADTEISALEEKIKSAKKQLTALLSQSDRLHDLLEQSIYDVDTFTERGRVLKEKISKAEQQISIYQSRLESIDKKPQLEVLLSVAENLLANYDTLSAQEKNFMYKKIISDIIYEREKPFGGVINLEITYRDWI